nr:uncharacterized protein LOC101797923 isoform X3 [Anas platyrhynchos]
MQGLPAPWVEAVGGRLGRRGGVLQRGDSSFVGPPRRHLCSDYKLSLPENLGSCHHRYCRKEESWNFFFRGKTCRKIGTSFVETSKSVYIKAEQLGCWAMSDCSIFTGQHRQHSAENTHSKRSRVGAGDSACWGPSCDFFFLSPVQTDCLPQELDHPGRLNGITSPNRP